MFRNSRGLKFLGIETRKRRNSDDTFILITFADPILFNKFDLFLPTSLMSTVRQLEVGCDVDIVLDLVQQGFNMRTELKEISLAEAA